MSEQLPYELLVRWDAAGTISAAHIRWQYTTPVGNVEGPPVPVSIADGTFPLSDLDEAIQSSALVTADAARVAKEAAEEERDIAVAALESVRSELAQLRARVGDLNQ